MPGLLSGCNVQRCSKNCNQNKVPCCLQWPGKCCMKVLFIVLHPEPSDVGSLQWLWSWLSAWHTLTAPLSNKLLGPWNYGSILPNICTMPMSRWAHKLLSCTPRILFALWLLLFPPRHRERAESCLGSYLCLWQENENSCCLCTSHSSSLGVHIWIKEKCFIKDKNCYKWVETCYQCCTIPVKAELAPTDWLTWPCGGLGLDNAWDTSLW